MNEEEYQSGFVRRTSDPTRAKHLKKPSRLKMTGDTLKSFLGNRKSGNLEKAFEKYNREYNELRRIAIEVNDAKSEAESKDEFTDVKDKLEEYNAQVKRLAESAVRILLFDEDIQKIKFKIDKDVEKSTARALKVPPFLIGPLKYLSSAGRAYMKVVKEEKEQAQEKLEQEIADVVAKNAREVVGLSPDGDNIELAAQTTMGKEEAVKLQSLADVGEIKDAVISELTAPSTDIPQPDLTSAPEEKTEEPTPDNERNTQVDIGVNKKKAQQQNLPKPEELMFEYYSEMVKHFGVELLKNIDRSKQKLVLYAKYNNEKRYLNPDMLAEVMENTNASNEEKNALYEELVDAVSFAQIWQEKASFSDENSDVFAFIYDAIKEGYGADTLIVKASRELSPEKQQILRNVVEGNFAMIRRTVENFDKQYEENKVDISDKEQDETRNAQVDEGVIKRRNKGKASEEAIPVTEENLSDNVEDNSAVVTEEVAPSQDSGEVIPISGDTEEIQAEQEGTKLDDDTITFKKINDRIRELAELKENLQKSGLSDDKSKEAIDKIDNELEVLVQRVSDLLDDSKTLGDSEQPSVVASSDNEPKKSVIDSKFNRDAAPNVIVDDSDEYSKFWGELYGKILDDPDGEKELSSMEKKGVDFDKVEEEYAIGRHHIDIEDSEKRHDELGEEIRQQTKEKADSKVEKAKKYVIGELLSSLGVLPRGMIEEWDQFDEQKADLGQVLKNVSENRKDDYDLAVEELASTLSESGTNDVNGEEVDFKKAITDILDDKKSKDQRKSAVSILKAVTTGDNQKTV